MMNRKEQDWYAMVPPLPASQGMLDGEYRLACAVFCQAVRDLHNIRYPLRAADALLWLCGDAYLWLDCLGIYVEPGKLLPLVAEKHDG